jgi:VanZ family protein
MADFDESTFPRVGIMRLLLLAFLFCGGVELLQIPLPTRHARGIDFVIDLFTACSAIAITLAVEKFLAKSTRDLG